MDDGEVPGGHTLVACNDGEDDDADGRIDSADPGCNGAADGSEIDPPTECNDGIDNDLDGWTDGSDPICTSPLVESEDDGPGPSPAECNDGIDDDSDGRIDELDPGCVSGGDDRESY